jgi:nucleotide-binding universal stress UspA family protein
MLHAKVAGRKKKRNTLLSSALVAVSGHSSDDHVVKLACELLDPQKAELYIVYVIEVERGLPVDAEIAPATARAEQVLKQMESVSRDYKFETQAELLQSRQAGLAVVQEAADKGVDAIVLGLPYKEVFGTFSLGDTVPYVLKHAPCQVILWRDMIPVSPSSNHQRQ